jgi:hypothetical protein
MVPLLRKPREKSEVVRNYLGLNKRAPLRLQTLNIAEKKWAGEVLVGDANLSSG